MVSEAVAKDGPVIEDPRVAPEDPRTSEPVDDDPSPIPKELDAGHIGSGNEKSKEVGIEKQGPHAGLTSGSSTAGSSADDEEQKKGTKKKSWYRRIRLNPFKRSHKPPIPETRQVSREYNASFFSLLTFQWMAPLMEVGYQRPLESNDIWAVNPDRSAEVLKVRLEAAFNKRMENGDLKALRGALYDTFKFDFILGGCCQLLAAILQSLAPFILRYLINFSTEAYYAQQSNQPPPSIGLGIGMVVGIVCMQITQTMATNHFMYRGMIVGGEARGVLIAIIFEKAMKISGRAKAGGKAVEAPPPDMKPGSEEERKWYQKMLGRNKPEKKDKKKGNGLLGDGQGWSNGRIINLMSTDTYRVDQAAGLFHMIWTSPISILLTLVLLIINLTYSALAGFALLVISTPLLGRAVRSLFHRRVAINKITDQRVSLTQEILSAVRFVKLFGWETSFLQRIGQIRKKEIRAIQKILAIRNGIMSVGMAMPVFASALSFITYSLSNHVLNPAPIFSSLALFNSMRLPLNFFPLVLGQVIDASSSLSRIQEFLGAEEATDEAEWDYNHENAVSLRNASFTWERTRTQNNDNDYDKKGAKKQAKAAAKAKKEADKNNSGTAAPAEVDEADKPPFTVKDLNLDVSRNELIAIIGTVGSGKTSLLSALAGDMRRTSGEVVLGAQRAYSPQSAWIMNATVKDNILFGTPFNEAWYDAVVDACALRPDLEMLPNGDMTEIGERGITVSGGQKQRLNIARAIYFNADIILMDDPLSAVDAHVGRHIMDQAICGLLANKCRILATHQLHVLNRCDRIVWLEEGKIAAVNTFSELMTHNEGFKELMATTAVEEEHEKTDEVNDKEEDEVEEDAKDAKKMKKPEVKGPALMQTEERAQNGVAFGVYGAYFKAAGTLMVAPLIIFLLILSQGSNIATSLWLSWWTSDNFGYSEGVYIAGYACLGLSQALFQFIFSVALSVFGTEAGKKMLHRAITRVLRAPMSFFDTTPLGRITNRFSKDIDTMDNNLSDSYRMFLLTFAMIISVFILIIAYYYYFAAALAPLFCLFLFAASYYRSSAREIKRHEAVLRSVVFSRFTEAVSGTATIRAYGLQSKFSASTQTAIDDMNSAYYLTFSNQRWLSVRLDAIGNLLIFITGILVVTSRFSVDPSIGGLVLSYILSIVGMIQFTIRQLAEVENNMNSVERIHYYGTSLEEEAPLKLGEVPSEWPAHGDIEFDNVQMRYRDGLPLVLKGLTMHVQAGERIGVVGRTGAGKSSLMGILFRLTELSGGSIKIDGIDISKIGLQDLRNRLSIIPQDPTLFKGTIRTNLDPFQEHTDLELWSALRRADLVSSNNGEKEEKGEGGSARITLDGIVEEEGLNFSLGQRQMMALARALVRNSQIIVADEATSSVDVETDAKIQTTMASEFRGKTLLCIAHRLKTIIGYDRICVMDEGKIAELDSPLSLYDQGGIFRGMCERSGIRREDILERPYAATTKTTTEE